MTKMTAEQIQNHIKRLIRKYEKSKEYADEKLRKFRRREKKLGMSQKGVIRTWHRRALQYRAIIRVLNFELPEVINNEGIREFGNKGGYGDKI